LHGIHYVHLELVKGPLQRPGPVHEVRDRYLGPVHHHRVGVHLAEGRLGVVPGVDWLRPERDEPVQQSDHRGLPADQSAVRAAMALISRSAPGTARPATRAAVTSGGAPARASRGAIAP